VEIREEVGADNFFLFGLTAEQVSERKARGYRPRDHYETNPHLREVLDQLSSGMFSDGDHTLFKPLIDSLLEHDPYMLLADYQSYVDCQDQVDKAYRNPQRWTRMSILNVARIGKFSSDRAIREYCQDIWQVEPLL
jgi:starch phosphorylase